MTSKKKPYSHTRSLLYYSTLSGQLRVRSKKFQWTPWISHVLKKSNMIDDVVRVVDSFYTSDFQSNIFLSLWINIPIW
jgi:hypothetical protein